MGLEVAVDYIDDLNQAWPLGTDPKSEGDDHIRYVKRALQGNVAGDGTKTELLVGGSKVLAAVGTEGILYGDDASNAVFRIRRRSDDQNLVALWWNDGNARTILSSQAPPESDLRLQVTRDSVTEVAVDFFGAGGYALKYQGTDNQRGVATGIEVQRAAASTLTKVGLYDGAGAQLGDMRVNAAGVLEVLNRGLLQPVKLNGSKLAANDQELAVFTPGAGFKLAFDGAPSVEGTSLGNLLVYPKGATNQGGSLQLGGEGANPDVLLDTFAGFARLLVNDAATEAVTWSSAGVMSQKAAAEINGELKVLGADLNVERTNNTATLLKVQGSQGGASLETQSGSGYLGLYDLNGANLRLWLAGDYDGDTTIYAGGGERMKALDVAVANSYGSVRDGGNTERAVGYNVMPTITIGSGGSRDLAVGDCGRKVRFNATPLTLTVPTGLPTDFTCTVWNEGNGDCTIAAGVGVTLTWFSGAGKVNGDFTVASGQAVTLTKRGTAEVWWIG